MMLKFHKYKLVIINIISLLIFLSGFYWGFFRDVNTYHHGPLRNREIVYGTTEGEVHIEIPDSVISRKDFIEFMEPMLYDSNRKKRNIAAEYITKYIKRSDKLFPSVQQRIWELCSETDVSNGKYSLILNFASLVDNKYTDKVIAMFDSETDKNIRSSLLYCLRKIRSRKAMEFLSEVALLSDNPDDALSAAEKISSGSYAKEIEIVEKYIKRKDAKKGSAPTIEERLNNMKKRLFYRRLSYTVTILFPILIFILHIFLRKRNVSVIRIAKLTIAEGILLLGYFLSFVYYVLSAVGGGDTGGFSNSFQKNMNYVFLFFLLGMYIVNVFASQKYFACIKAIWIDSQGKYANRAIVLFGIILLNVTLLIFYLHERSNIY